jgi:hypothetical protein
MRERIEHDIIHQQHFKIGRKTEFDIISQRANQCCHCDK